MMYLEMGGLKRLAATIAAPTRETIIGKLKPVVKRSGPLPSGAPVFAGAAHTRAGELKFCAPCGDDRRRCALAHMFGTHPIRLGKALGSHGSGAAAEGHSSFFGSDWLLRATPRTL